MQATVIGSVLVSRDRVADGGKRYVDLYILQDGERDPLVCYAEAADLPAPPVAGSIVEADVRVWASKFQGGTLSVRVLGLRAA